MIADAVCTWCGSGFTGAPRKKFCSDRCRYSARDARPEVKDRQNQQRRARYTPTGRRPGPPRTQPAECVVDGCDREPLALSKCQRHYRAQRYAEGVPWAQGGGKNNDRARARQHGVAYEPINRLEVYERDGWICGICGGPVEKDDASLDHVVPMSRGGAHLYSNVQCAHLLCNIRKGASHGDLEAIDLPAPELADRG